LEAGSRWEDIAEAEAAVDQARANLDEARSRLELAETQVRRNRTLREEGAISQDDLDRVIDERNRAAASLSKFEAALEEAQRRLERTRNGPRSQDIDQARADVDEARSQLQELLNGSRAEDIAMAEADVAEAEGQVRYYEIQLEDTKVRAPFAGVVSQRYADPGSFVTPATSASSASSATSTSILSLAQGLEVLAEVPEADISQIEAGQEVEIVADAYPDEIFKGRVKLIAPEAVEEQNVTLFQVRLDVETGADKLRSGMTVDLTFLGDRLEDALVVPTVAIVTKQGETGVLVPDADGDPEFQTVTIGPSVGNKIQILDGVETGDRVFVGLPEGQELDDIIGQ
jgi:HlyD family secretion protein